LSEKIMKLSSKLTKKFLSVFTPILTASLATPSYAANFSAESFLSSFGFSQEATEITTFINTNAIAESGLDSFIEANAAADSIVLNNSGFDLECSNTEFIFRFVSPAACSNTFSQVATEGNNVDARADSEAEFIATFLIYPETIFSFDFVASLNLEAEATELTEKAFNTSGEIALDIYDLDTNTLIDSFTLFANINPQSNNDVLLTDGTIEPLFTDFDSFFGGDNEFADAFVDGTYSRFFGQTTNIAIVGSNRTSITPVPEASQTFAVLFFLGLVAAKTKFTNNHNS
jgi:hypothetical protein